MFVLRLVLAMVVSYYALNLLVNLIIVVARSGGDTLTLNGEEISAAPMAFSFFYASLIDVVLWIAAPRAWRWALASRPRPFRAVLDQNDAAPRPHQSLGGEVEPPSRW